MSHDHDPDQTAIVRLADLARRAQEDDTLRVPTLTVIQGRQVGRVLRLPPGSTMIGRAPNLPLSLPDEGISRNHVEVLVRNAEEVMVRDLGSTNGSFLNERRLTHRLKPMRDGDRLRLAGSVLLSFALKDPLEESAQQQVYDQALRDALTGLFNKRHLTEQLDLAFEAAARGGQPLSLIIFDLDHFKAINDGFGHAIGDVVLREVARAARRALRQDELLARYGGEELVVLLPDTPPDVARLIAERLRSAIAGLNLLHEDTPIPVTASFGVASTQEERFATPEALFVRADQRLYQAKRAGRDRVVAEGPGRPGGPHGA